MSTVEITNYPNLNPEERKRYAAAIKEMTDSLARIQAEKELLKEIASQQKENYGIAPAVTNKAAKIAFERSLDEAAAEAEELFAWIDVTLSQYIDLN